MIDALLQVINKAWEAWVIPHEWKKWVVEPIPKPGKPHTSLQALRPISLTPTIYKLYAKDEGGSPTKLAD